MRFVLILLVIFITEERGASRPVPSSRINSSSKVNLLRSQDISFGGAITGLTPGTIIVNPNGLVSYTGGIMRNFRTGVPPAHPAQLIFTLYNAAHCHDVDHAASDDDEAVRHEIDDARTDDDRLDFIRHGTNVQVSLPNLSTLQLASNPSEQMTADHFTLLRREGTFTIGATLHAGAMQAPGMYTGSFVVTVICE
jgi:hypothetical protein